jgi:hypothetical protein
MKNTQLVKVSKKKGKKMKKKNEKKWKFGEIRKIKTKIKIFPSVMSKETADSSSYNVCTDSRTHWQQP